MQIFCPYPEPLNVAKAMWNDRLRYNKQIVEAIQIIKAIEGAKAWRNHPIVKMYKEHEDWLICYAKCLTAFRDYMETKDIKKINEAVAWSANADLCKPSFLTDELCDQHKRRLYTKSTELYPQFAKYGKSDVNFYFVDGELLKYKDGKRIKE